MPTPPATAFAPGLLASARTMPCWSVAAGSLLMAVAAHVAVPFWPVPLTLQSLAVLGLGVVLGPAAAVAAVLAWIVEGAIGLPVFAAGGGPAILAGPTSGYILGFLPAAAIAGLAARRSWLAKPGMAFLAFLAADAALFAAGVAWLAVLFGWRTAIGGGLTPFLLGEALKIGIATLGVTLASSHRPRRS